jgi:hypothetical protein
MTEWYLKRNMCRSPICCYYSWKGLLNNSKYEAYKARVVRWRARPELLFLSPIVSLGCCIRVNGCWRLCSVLRASQWELSSAPPFPTYFLYNPKFRLADCFACHLLSYWFPARLILRPWKWRRYVRLKLRLIFNGLHGVISEKISNSL